MKAIAQTRYGSLDALSFIDIDPPQPTENQVLVRVHATSMHADIWHVVMGRPYALRLMGGGFRKPKQPVLGTDIAGVVETVGAQVTRFKPGDRVFGETVNGFQWKNGGAYAELAVIDQVSLALIPEHLNFEEAAAATTSGLIALRALTEEGRLIAGHRVLINGAGGAVGSMALVLAKALGATVTAVDLPHKLNDLKTMGADAVVDGLSNPVANLNASFDLILDVASNLNYTACRHLLTPQGLFVFIGHDHFGRIGGAWLGSIPRAIALVFRAFWDPHLPKGHIELKSEKAMVKLVDLLASQRIKPHVGRIFALSEARQALECLMRGEAVGKIVIRVPSPNALARMSSCHPKSQQMPIHG
jgi:NADPH:quinone reductase-like Zn-dependent oxidoreductase